MADLKATMVFERADGKQTTMSVGDADPALTAAELNAAMDTILTRNVFAPDNVGLIKKISGKLVSPTSQDFEMTV